MFRFLYILLTLVSFFILLFIYTKLAGPIPFFINSVSTTKSDTFSVSGEGKVSIKPDIAVVNVGVVANAQTVKAVQDQLNTSINNVSQAIKNLGISDKDIKTQNYSIYPVYDYNTKPQKISGYSASTNLETKVRDINKINQVIDAATSNGANQVSGVSFDVDDKSKSQEEARKLAVDDAKKKAQQAAKIAGFSLGKIINYSENLGGFGPVYDTISAVGLGAGGGAVEPSKVEPGSNEVVVNVTLSYEIQ